MFPFPFLDHPEVAEDAPFEAELHPHEGPPLLHDLYPLEVVVLDPLPHLADLREQVNFPRFPSARRSDESGDLHLEVDQLQVSAVHVISDSLDDTHSFWYLRVTDRSSSLLNFIQIPICSSNSDGIENAFAQNDSSLARSLDCSKEPLVQHIDLVAAG